jgi:PTS system N-acetylglucosamine-specific IIC component
MTKIYSVDETAKGQVLSAKQKKEKPQKQKNKFWSGVLLKLQMLGKALLYPIAVLPFAALLNRFGSLAMELNPIHDGVKNAGYWFGFILAQPGATIFNNLALIFAIGTAFGLATDNRGESALIGAAMYLILVAFLSEGGIPELIYKKVLTFDVFDKDGKIVDHLSQLFYVKGYAVDGANKLFVSSGTYILDIGVLGGIVSGCLTAYIYNKFKNIKLPMALSFFGGRRFIPMMMMVISFPVAFLFAVIWPWCQFGLVKFGEAISSGDAWAVPGAFLYGLINRFIQPFGLHHIINTFLWFQLPIEGNIVSAIDGKIVLTSEMISNYVNQDGTIKNLPEFVNYLNQIVDNQGLHLSHFQNVDGKILTDGNEWTDYFVINWDKISSSNNTIIMGDPQAATAYVFGDINAFQKSLISGNFQTGYFPMYWGGLTAACAAMILAAPKGKRKKTATFLGGIAVVAALTGIDEPVVFSFIFVGPILWVYNAVFTAIFCAIGVAMHMHIGFGFSGGFIDYIISFATSWGMSKWEGLAHGSVYGVLSNPLWMLLLAVAIAPCYFFSFYFTIKKMDIKTPGRDDQGADDIPAMNEHKQTKSEAKAAKKDKYAIMGQKIVDLIGVENFEKVDNCSTRLRLVVKDNQVVSDAQLKEIGAFGATRLGTQGLQIIIGTDVEAVADVVHNITHK